MNGTENKNRTIYIGYLVHDEQRFSKLSNEKTDYSINWISKTSCFEGKKAESLPFITK